MSAITPAFWQGRRVFITGHTGFKGGWLALWLADLGAQVAGYALAPNTEPSLFDAIQLAPLLDRHLLGDVRDADQLRKAVVAFQPQVVLHLAAQPLVRESYAQPVATYATNVMGTLHLLEAARAAGSVQVIVCVTTDKVYQNREWHWGYREIDTLGGHDPYSSSKAAAEIAVASWRSSFLAQAGVAVATARAGNVIGGGDWCKDRLIPDAARAFAEGRAVEVRSPGATRPWQHVTEPLRGYLMLAEACHRQPQRHATPYNFGPLHASVVSVGEVVDSFSRAWGGSASWVDTSSAASGPHEATALSLDVQKAMRQLGWRPQLSLDQATQFSARWYQAHARGAGAAELRALMRAQISAAEG